MKFVLKIDDDKQGIKNANDLSQILHQVNNAVDVKCVSDLSKKAHGKIVNGNGSVIGYWEFDPENGEGLDENL